MIKNPAGLKFGKLTIIKELDNIFSASGTKYRIVYCKCDCGKECSVKLSNLTKGHTSSCGCLHKKHGEFNTKLYKVWAGMVRRCHGFTDDKNLFKHYQKRGIKVCDEWRFSYLAFSIWAKSNGYSVGLELDRINNDGNYEPSNCRFVSRSENQRNKRTSIFGVIDGRSKLIIEWAEYYGIPYSVFMKRFLRGSRGEKLISPVRFRRKSSMEGLY
jgi:hypothetical protein